MPTINLRVVPAVALHHPRGPIYRTYRNDDFNEDERVCWFTTHPLGCVDDDDVYRYVFDVRDLANYREGVDTETILGEAADAGAIAYPDPDSVEPWMLTDDALPSNEPRVGAVRIVNATGANVLPATGERAIHASQFVSSDGGWLSLRDDEGGHEELAVIYLEKVGIDIDMAPCLDANRDPPPVSELQRTACVTFMRDTGAMGWDAISETAYLASEPSLAQLDALLAAIKMRDADEDGVSFDTDAIEPTFLVLRHDRQWALVTAKTDETNATIFNRIASARAGFEP